MPVAAATKSLNLTLLFSGMLFTWGVLCEFQCLLCEVLHCSLFGLQPGSKLVEMGSQYSRALTISCSIPDDCIDSNRYPLFMARAVLPELIESLQSSPGSVKPCRWPCTRTPAPRRPCVPR